jgi:hypothetical protein
LAGRRRAWRTSIPRRVLEAAVAVDSRDAEQADLGQLEGKQESDRVVVTWRRESKGKGTRSAKALLQSSSHGLPELFGQTL